MSLYTDFYPAPVPKNNATATGAALIPGGDDTERAAITTPVAGMFRYNDQTAPAVMEYYDGATWKTLSTGGGGGGFGIGSVTGVFTGVIADRVVDVAYGNGVYVILLYNAGYYTMTSSDGGYTWGNRSQRGTSTSTQTSRSRVIFDGTQFCVFTRINSSQLFSYLSGDGITWTPNASAGFINFAASANSYAMSAGNGNFVVTGWTGAVQRFYYSTDGLAWNLSANTGTANTYGVQWAGGNNFVSPAFDGSVRLSTDGGATWTVQAGTFPVSTTSANYPNPTWDGTNTIWSIDSATTATNSGIWSTATGATVTQRASSAFYSSSTSLGSNSYTVYAPLGSMGIAFSADSYANMFIGYTTTISAGAIATDGSTVVTAGGGLNNEMFVAKIA